MTTTILATAGSYANFVEFYAENLRSELFNGFLASGSFLLAATTFIVITMKTEVYGEEEYAVRYQNSVNLGHRKAMYAPLTSLTGALIRATALSLLCAFVQLTLGLVPDPIAVAACLVVAGCACVAMLQALWFIRVNLKSYLKHLEKNAPIKPPIE